jgi:hypothetical protein
MRSSSLVFAALPAMWLTAVVAQEPTSEELRELLCEQCPFDAPVSPSRRFDYSIYSATTVITADEMRSLGVVSVADMISQLSQSAEQDSVPENTESGGDEQSAESGETDSGETESGSSGQ